MFSSLYHWFLSLIVMHRKANKNIEEKSRSRDLLRIRKEHSKSVVSSLSLDPLNRILSLCTYYLSLKIIVVGHV